MNARDWVRWSTEAGDPIEQNGIRAIPESWALTIRWPSGGLVWNRPAAVRIERGNTVERIPIVDITRWAVVGAFGSTILFLVLTNIFLRRK